MTKPRSLSEIREISKRNKEIQEIKNHLADRDWRINNLYYIKDDQGRHVKFQMNKVQREVYDNLWYLNIILKARQHGITTLFCILFLDDTLFGLKDSGIIAHTLFDAQKMFDTKIRYAFNNLPDWLKAEYEIDQNNARTLKFKRGTREASIYVGTSLRGGTVQNLHITELGTIDQKEPDKAEEIKTGALNTVHKGQVIVIESTAKGQYGIFYDFCKEAMNLEIDIKAQNKELTSMDYRFFFFPWYFKPEYSVEENGIIIRETIEYFNHLKAETGYPFTKGQMLWYQNKKKHQKDAMFKEFPSTPDEAFQASVEGSYYGKQIDKIRENKQILRVPYEGRTMVDTWWDLGVGDSTVIIFTQSVGYELRIIDHYENSGEGLAHYANVLKERGYSYRSHNAPHDIAVRELTTGKSRLETAVNFGIHFNVVDKLSVDDGIEAVRNLLPRCYFDEENCHKLVKALSEYRKEWDPRLGTFKNKPLHNWASHSADAMRCLAVGIKDVLGKPLGMDNDTWNDLRQRQEEPIDSHRLFPF